MDAHHQGDDGGYYSTFDVMAEVSGENNNEDMCVFSFQELRLPNNQIDDDSLLELIYNGDNAGKRMFEMSRSYTDNVVFGGCTIGRIGATAACTNAKSGTEGFRYHTLSMDDDADDDGGSTTTNTPTYYKNRFCKSAVQKSKIDHPQAITIFRLNSNTQADTEALLEAWKEGHANSMQWAYSNNIGMDGHMLAKIVPCSEISQKFKTPSSLYPKLSNTNGVCDYVGDRGITFAEEALMEWQDLCSVWPLDVDGSRPKCKRRSWLKRNGYRLAHMMRMMVLGVLVGGILYFQWNKRRQKSKMQGGTVDEKQLLPEMS